MATSFPLLSFVSWFLLEYRETKAASEDQSHTHCVSMTHNSSLLMCELGTWNPSGPEVTLGWEDPGLLATSLSGSVRHPAWTNVSQVLLLSLHLPETGLGVRIGAPGPATDSAEVFSQQWEPCLKEDAHFVPPRHVIIVWHNNAFDGDNWFQHSGS